MLHTDDRVRYYNIDSRMRQNGISEDFEFKIPPIHAKKIQVVDVILPNSWYPIKENQRFTFTTTPLDDGLDKFVILPAGFKTADEIVDSVQAQVRVYNADFKCRFNTETGKFEFSNGVPLFPGDPNIQLGNSEYIFTFPNDNDSYLVLGFAKGANTSLNGLLIAPSVAQIDGEHYLLVDSNIAIQGFNGAYHQGVLAKIHIDQNPGNVIFHRRLDDIYDIDQQISNLNFRLTWMDNKPVDLKGRSWSISLKIFH